jgi:hypothetical protein
MRSAIPRAMALSLMLTASSLRFWAFWRRATRRKVTMAMTVWRKNWLASVEVIQRLGTQPTMKTAQMTKNGAPLVARAARSAKRSNPLVRSSE